MAQLVNVERLLTDREAQRGLLDQIGALYVSASQKSFSEQRWGSTAWPARYPSQRSPKINIAGVIKDFNAGRRKPLKSRFQDRPALVDTGDLKRSISHRVVVEGGEAYVEIGTTLPYATLQQYGGTSTIVITEAARDAARKWLGTKEGYPFRSRLWRIVSVRSGIYTVDVIGRRFVGTTPELEKRAAKMIVRYAGGMGAVSDGG